MKRYDEEQSGHREEAESAAESARSPDPKAPVPERDRVAELEARLEEKNEEAKANLDRYLRTLAESDNFKKRIQREKSDSIRYANENIVRDLIPIIDNLERAVEHAELGGDGRSLVEGVAMTLRLFRDLLDRQGVKELNVEPGATFDPAYHEASEVQARPDFPANTVIAQRGKGYLLHDRLIRPARVVVAATAPGTSRKDESEH